MNTPCRNCKTPKPPRMYLCGQCWGSLTPAARRALNRRDSMAFARLRDLHRQVDAGILLADIKVTP